MSRTILKNHAGKPIDLDGAHVIVKNAQNRDASLEDELAGLRASLAGLLACSDALTFKGLVTAGNPLPANNYKAGWTYKIGETGIYAGQQCEVGDMAICVREWDAASASEHDWQVIQTNIDGAVTGPASAIAGNVPVFSGASGKVIADSSLKQTDLSQAVGMKHQHANSGTLVLLGQNTEGELTFSGQVVVVGDVKVDCVVINAGEEIPANLSENGVIFEIQGS